MGFVIKLANLIKQVHDNEELNQQDGADKVFNDDWIRFIAGELKQSNETNAKNLGGKPRMFMEEEETNFEVNMEKIMSRFNTFNSIVSQSSNDDDDDDKGEDEPDDEDNPEPLTQLGTPVEMPKIEVELPENTSLETEYTDSSYWKLSACEDSLADLLADYQ